jgi:hypothetical protein
MYSGEHGISHTLDTKLDRKSYEHLPTKLWTGHTKTIVTERKSDAYLHETYE